MEFRIIWSEFAEHQLDNIYNFYLESASPSVASKLLKNIIHEADRLTHRPEIGQIEENLLERNIEYRYLIYKNYKLIYSIDRKSGFIKMADVFDTRQNPTKLKRNK